MLDAAVERLEGKLWWSNITVGMLPGPFTLSDARRVYEAIAQTRYDPATFGRDLKATGLIEPTGEQRADGTRPARRACTASRPTAPRGAPGGASASPPV